MDIQDMTRLIVEFRDERNWKKFHTPKDMVLSLILESSELAEHFQYVAEKDLDKHISEKRKEIGEELSDILYWVLLIANDFEIDLKKAFIDKMELNKKKYPKDKAHGKNLKYSEL